MRKHLPRRFWVEIGFASAAGFFNLLTVLFPDWIELVSNWEPDQHRGSAEWLLVAGLFMVTVILLALAALEWRRARCGAPA